MEKRWRTRAQEQVAGTVGEKRRPVAGTGGETSRRELGFTVRELETDLRGLGVRTLGDLGVYLGH